MSEKNLCVYVGNLGNARINDIIDAIKPFAGVKRVRHSTQYHLFLDVDTEDEVQTLINESDKGTIKVGTTVLKIEKAKNPPPLQEKSRRRSKNRYDSPPRYHDSRYRESRYDSPPRYYDSRYSDDEYSPRRPYRRPNDYSPSLSPRYRDDSPPRRRYRDDSPPRRRYHDDSPPRRRYPPPRRYRDDSPRYYGDYSPPRRFRND